MVGCGAQELMNKMKRKIIKITQQQSKMLKEHIILENMSWSMGSRKSLSLKERNEIKESLKTLKEGEMNISELNKIIEKYDHALSIAESDIVKLRKTLGKVM